MRVRVHVRAWRGGLREALQHVGVADALRDAHVLALLVLARGGRVARDHKAHRARLCRVLLAATEQPRHVLAHHLEGQHLLRCVAQVQPRHERHEAIAVLARRQRLLRRQTGQADVVQLELARLVHHAANRDDDTTHQRTALQQRAGQRKSARLVLNHHTVALAAVLVRHHLRGRRRLLFAHLQDVAVELLKDVGLAGHVLVQRANNHRFYLGLDVQRLDRCLGQLAPSPLGGLMHRRA